MYFSQDPSGKGELIIGSHTEGFGIQEGIKSGRHQGLDYCFTLITPRRDFVLMANTENEMKMWIDCLSKVIAQPMTDEDKQGWGFFFALLITFWNNSINFSCVREGLIKNVAVFLTTQTEVTFIETSNRFIISWVLSIWFKVARDTWLWINS